MKKLSLSIVILMLSLCIATAVAYADTETPVAMVSFNNFLETIEEKVGYMPTYTEENEFFMLIHFAHGMDRKVYYENHNGNVIIAKSDADNLLRELSTGTFSYSWYPTEGKTWYPMRDGLIEVEDLSEPFVYHEDGNNADYIRIWYGNQSSLMHNGNVIQLNEQDYVNAEHLAQVFYNYERMQHLLNKEEVSMEELHEAANYVYRHPVEVSFVETESGNRVEVYLSEYPETILNWAYVQEWYEEDGILIIKNNEVIEEIARYGGNI